MATDNDVDSELEDIFLDAIGEVQESSDILNQNRESVMSSTRPSMIRDFTSFADEEGFEDFDGDF